MRNSPNVLTCGVLLGHVYLQVPMMGSAVSLLPFKEAGQHFCLSMVSGITTLALQVLSPILHHDTDMLNSQHCRLYRAQLLSSSASCAIAGSAAAGLLTECACMTSAQCAITMRPEHADATH
jgi:hypothetical protein